jgi:cyclase
MKLRPQRGGGSDLKARFAIDRRDFLGVGLALAGSAVLPRVAPASTSLSLRPLTPRIWLVEGAAANIVVASAGGELVLVDGGSAADAKALEALLEQNFPGQKLRAVFNTHWHHAQVGFNATARARGADVLAHENTRLWLTTDVNSRWEGKVYKRLPKEAWPNRTFFYDPQVFEFAGGRVEYVHLGQAHTDGDIYVRFPEDNVIVTGDVFTPGRYPLVDTATNGYLGGINTALRTIAGVSNDSTRLVPGSGPAVTGLDALNLQLEMGQAVLVKMSDNYRKGGTFEEFVATRPTADYDARLGDPSQFLKLAYDSAWYQVNPMGGLTTGQPPAGRSR